MKKIIWDKSSQIDYLRVYINQILNVLAEICSCPGMANAYVSDKSHLDHFLIVLCDNKKKKIAIEELKQMLMVDVDGTEDLATIAKRMAGIQ